MKDLSYFATKVKYILYGRSDEVVIKYFKKMKMDIGANCHIFSFIMTTEPYLIHIGDNTTISSDVQFITHDNCISKIINDATDTFGEIHVGKNCFIGAGSIILPGISLADNTVVAAGSVVTKSVNESGLIVGGNPAIVIGDWNSYRKSKKDYGLNINGLSEEEKRELLLKNPDKLIRR